MQRGIAATTIVVLDFFGGFACLKAFGVARVRHELCDGESNALQAFSGMASSLKLAPRSLRGCLNTTYPTNTYFGQLWPRWDRRVLPQTGQSKETKKSRKVFAEYEIRRCITLIV